MQEVHVEVQDQVEASCSYINGRPIRTLEYFLPNRPFTKKKLRACLSCGLLKHFLDFRRDGCDNCDRLLNMRYNSDKVIMFTSLIYEGVIGLTEDCRTWRSRYFFTIKSFCVGIYAVHVVGTISDYAMNKILFPHFYNSDDESEDERCEYQRG